MEESKKPYQTWPLARWQEMFEELYGERNSHKTVEEVFLHVVEEAGELAEALRKDTLDEIKENIPDVFAWLCSFATHRKLNLEEVVWHKFPNVCPYCFKQENCLCIAEMHYLPKEERDKRLAPYREDVTAKPKTLDEWQATFLRIYGNVNRVMHFSDIGFHYMEEIGEVSREIRLGTQEEFEDELADVFAWIIAICMRRNLNLSLITWDRFPYMCWVCQSRPCKCEKIELRRGPRSGVT